MYVGKAEGMGSGQLVILVTGSIASGKTSFLERLHRSTAKWWRSCGFFSPGSDARSSHSGTPSAAYTLSVIGQAGPQAWARRKTDGSGFEFCAATRSGVTATVSAQLDCASAEICFLDEIGPLELAGEGFAGLFRHALASRCRIVVAAVRKSRLAEVIDEFRLAGAVVIDLDHVSVPHGLREARRRLAATDAERIGAFAGIGGLVEVGLGSTLHAYRVPFKGHALAYLQNVLLIAFGKALHGRGLVRISFITAMLKSFSPVGSTFKPMGYIFLQGLSFAAPVRLLGWNPGTVVLGSIMMAWLTLALSLAVNYVTFGSSIFNAYGGVIRSVSGWFGVQGPALAEVLAGAFALKALIAVALAAGAFFGNLQPLVHRLSRQPSRAAASRAGQPAAHPQRSLRATACAALRDLARPRFVIAFLVSVMLLLFFAHLSRRDLMNLVVRGLCISYLGFVVLRRADFRSFGTWLDRRAGLGLGKSLPVALEVLGHPQQPADPGTEQQCAAASSSAGAVARSAD